ncbi:MAG: hypothetical protein AB8H79_23995, partial [Myxococcota bacterium]
DGGIEGTLDGHEVVVAIWKTPGRNSIAFTRATVSLREPMPTELRVTRHNALGMIQPLAALGSIAQLIGAGEVEVGTVAAGAPLNVRGQNRQDADDLLANPALAEATDVLRGPYDELNTVRARVCKQGRAGAEVADLLTRALTLAKSASEARIAPWKQLETEPGLTLTFDGANAHLSGSFDGMNVSMVGDRKSGEVIIEVRLTPGLPADLHVEKGEGDLGDFILDRTVKASGATPEALLQLLSDDDIKEHLLSVVHGFEGSTVTAQQVTLKTQSFSDPELRERLLEAVRLARGLNERQATVASSAAERSHDVESETADKPRPPKLKQPQ